MNERIKNILSAITGSYSQVFFSNNRWLALLLLLASFADPAIGLSGLLSVLFALVVANSLGLNPAYVRNGWYTYNVLLMGMAMGAYYQFNAVFLVMLLLASILSLVLSVWLASLTSRYKLPFLSIPFVLSIWIVFLNARSFQTNILLERNGFLPVNTILFFSGKLSKAIEEAGLPTVCALYFKTIASIFFQDKVLTGMIISAGLLISSRIAFFLSWLGFLAGYLFFRFTLGGAAVSDYYYTGFNYVFSAIALAGFYLVPSLSAFGLVIFSVPLIAMLNAALIKIMGPYFLPLYSLPFSLTVIVLISVLNNRYSLKGLDMVQYQLFSPEKNLYAFITFLERFKKDTLVQIHLPFYGEWSVSQGHSGEQTHKEEWRYAWDFVVTDERNHTFKLPGKQVSDFYCYALPILAPADGKVVTLEDGIEDNAIGDANLEHNWGNTIVIKHAEYLYSKISHIKKDSFKVKVGDEVKKGDVLALCGNSGRSPEPHIHFQLQGTPFIGAPTLLYPISYYLVKNNNAHKLHAFDVPEKGQRLLRPISNPMLKKAFHFVPGMKVNFEVSLNEQISTEHWEVFTDAYNHSYLYCAKSNSSAHFTQNENMFYFTGYSGNKQALLYYFYLAAYKVVMSNVEGLTTTDRFPVETSKNHLLKPLQDFIAPVYVFLKPVYACTVKTTDIAQPGRLLIQSQFKEGENKEKGTINFEIEVADNTIKTFTINKDNVCIVAKHIA